MAGKRRSKRVVAVDWDPRNLRVVHVLLTKRGVKIERLLSAAIPADVDAGAPEQMGAYIRQTLEQEGISTRHAIVDIPRDQAILKTLVLPTTQPEELPGMVEIQIAKELPFPASEAAIDFAVEVAQQDSPKGDVLVAAVRREVLEQYAATFAAAGLRLDRIGLRPYASKMAVAAFLKHAMPDRVLFIDVRPTFMEIDVIRSGSLAFSRSASVTVPEDIDEGPILSLPRPGVPGEAEGSEAAPAAPGGSGAGRRRSVVQALMLEVSRSIEAYRAGDPGAAIDHVVLAGDTGVEDDLAEAIQSRLQLSVEQYNPASTFGWEPDEGAGASSFAASLGLVLGHAQAGEQQFDFLHPKRMESVTRKKLRKAPMAVAAVVVFVAGVAAVFSVVTAPKRETLAKLERNVAELKRRRSDYKDFLGLVDGIEQFDREQIIWVDALYEVFSLLPSHEELIVTYVDMDQREHRVDLKTQTRARETPVELIRKMEAYRRRGHEDPRLKVTMGPQREKKHEAYPFSQELKIYVLDDGPGQGPLESVGSSG